MSARWPEEQTPIAPQLELLEPENPPFLAAPETRIEHAFRAFHDRHPEVYAILEVEVWTRVKAGATRLGVKRLVEDMRWDETTIADEDGEFKLNNNFTALYARLLVHRHPDWASVFELRRRIERRRPESR